MIDSIETLQPLEITQKLKIFKIQRTCVYDGPGIRTTIFFRGCGLRCLWCQNPEMQSFQEDIASDRTYTIEEIVEMVSRDKKYYTSTKGGVTLSGGEPLLQDPDSLIGLIELLKKENIPISAETTLHMPWENIRKVAPYIDLFIVDLKVVGDDALHLKLTKQNSILIASNIRKLLELDAKIKFRMVMVPGLNDGETNIKTAAGFLKSINYDSIELLKYHNLYVDKAKRFGLETPALNITVDQSIISLKNGIELFKKYGIKAENTELDSSRQQGTFTPRVLEIQKAIRESPRAFCIEKSYLTTKYYKKFKGLKKPVHIHRAERLSYVLKNKRKIIYPLELLVGNFTTKRSGAQIWEEYFGTLNFMVMYRLSRQKPVRFRSTFKERMTYYFYTFPFWQRHGLVAKVFPGLKNFINMLAHGAQAQAGFLNNMAAIAHFIVNFDRILSLGTAGIIDEIQKTAKTKPENNQDFYNGAIIALHALEDFAQNYADVLLEHSKGETDPMRRKEFEEMARICAYVPKNPARTYHEALQAMTFLQIALCIESFENAISYGRLDQVLYPYYKKDLDAGRITYEKAKELICLFILKMEECVLVNDGDSILSLSRLFETLSTDQTLTFGGMGKDGKDATNDVTYMLCDACELQPLSVNMVARIHKDSPQRYLDRLAELYLNGCPMPELFSDDIYIKSIMKHYPTTTIEHARNYSIVGCVEPVASDNHFGNTDCANINLAMPLLQALKGHEYDLWNFPFSIQWERLTTNSIEYYFRGKKGFSKWIVDHRHKAIKKKRIKEGSQIYNPPSTMEELLERFQARLNHVADKILKHHQLIETNLQKFLTTPLASSLYTACVANGKDVYEGGTTYNTSGIQAIGVTDVADSFFAINEIVFKQKRYTLLEVLKAIDNNFEGEFNQKVWQTLQAVPKFGDDGSREATEWVTKVMQMYNIALDSVRHEVRNGKYTAGYYALNVADIYGKHTQALPSGRLDGVPLANSVTPHYGMEKSDLLSSLNAVAGVNFTDFAVNGSTVTFTIDAALFQGAEGVKNLAQIFKTFLTEGGQQFQPNVISREILLDAYAHPEKHKYLMVRVAGYCAYFNELCDDLKQIIINRTCYQ